jgi:organic radical activating enzyme
VSERASGERLKIHEIYRSLQGESTHAGRPCTFVRLTGCQMRCVWCDSAHAFYEGTWRSLDEILAEVARLGADLVEVTGGEPLLQPAVLPLMTALCDAGSEVLLETGGGLDISGVDPRVRRILDIKCPGSGEAENNRWENLGHLRAGDELKLVLRRQGARAAAGGGERGGGRHRHLPAARAHRRRHARRRLRQHRRVPERHHLHRRRAGILRYRGYPDRGARRARFTEVAYLLIYGELPTAAELAVREKLTYHSLLHEDMKKFFEGFPPRRTRWRSSRRWWPRSRPTTRTTKMDVDLNIVRLLAKAKTIAAFSYKKSIGQPFIYPQNRLATPRTSCT